MNTVLIVCFFTAVIHMSEALALSMRLAGVKTNQIATSISFVNVSFLVSRMANMLQAPLLGAMVDSAIRTGTASVLGVDFRYIIFAAFIGNLLGAFFTPTMANIFVAGIKIFEKQASIPRLLVMMFLPKNIMKIIKSFRLPKLSMLSDVHFNRIPHGFLYFNIFVVGIYAVGVLSSLFAGALLPDLRATAVQLSGIVNGMATIMLAMFVDPGGAHITDQCIKKKRPISDVKTTIFFLLLGRIIATFILAQLIFIPATNYIIYFTKLIGGSFGQ